MTRPTRWRRHENRELQPCLLSWVGETPTDHGSFATGPTRTGGFPHQCWSHCPQSATEHARNLEAIRFFHREGFRLLGRLELSLQLDPDAGSALDRELELHRLRFGF